MNTADIDTTNMCSHLRHKLMDADGIYHPIWQTIQDDPELTAVVRSRQLHIYRNGKKVLILAFADNKGATLKDAIRCWHWKKLQAGSHRYEKSDFDAVKD